MARIQSAAASPYASLAFDSLCHSLSKTKQYPLEFYKHHLNASASQQPQQPQHETDSPLFVTWNITINDETHLRGCIGTFSALPVERGIREYALIAAFEDTRFNPISVKELGFLECSVTLLKNFELCNDPLDWELGKHGIKINFSYQSRNFSGTFLPEVATEQGWDKKDTIENLIKKAGFYKSVNYNDLNNLKVTRYQGIKTKMNYKQYKDLRDKIDDSNETI